MSEITVSEFSDAFHKITGMLTQYYGDITHIDQNPTQLEAVVKFLWKNFPDITEDDEKVLSNRRLAEKYVGNKMRDAMGLLQIQQNSRNTNSTTTVVKKDEKSLLDGNNLITFLDD